MTAYDVIMAMDADALMLAIARTRGWARTEDYTGSDWPRDIAAAWRLAEEENITVFHLAGKGKKFLAIAVKDEIDFSFGGGWLECQFWEGATGDTAPLAICRAYLLRKKDES